MPLLLLLFIPTGCGRDEHVIELDRRYSINVVKTPAWFPGEETPLSPAEDEILYQRGRPDRMRFWWREDGSFISSSDLSGKHDEVGQRLQEITKSWIYLLDEEEVVFRADGGAYDVQPMTEVLKLICEYGDPNHRSPPHIINGMMHETWQWYDRGIMIKLIDGKEVERKYLPATGEGTWGLK